MRNSVESATHLTSSTVKGVAFTLISALAWGSSFPVIRWGVGFINPLVFLFFRFLTASLFTTPLIIKNIRAIRRLLGSRYIILIGVLNAIGYLLEFTGLAYTTASKASLLVNLNAVFVALFAAFILGERLNKRRLLALTIGLTGALTVILNGDLSIIFSGSLTGDILVLAAGLIWALYIVYSKKVVEVEDSNSSADFFNLTWVNLILSTVIFTPFALTFMIADSSFFTSIMTSEVFFSVAYLSLVCTVLAFLLYFKGLKYISASSVAVILLSEILFAVLISYIFLFEPVTLYLIIGGFLITLAVLLS
ncbi:MAG: DMT family transporter [Candidatus Odinarchaeum yellowstonii]|uniref:DMT family transporter n=1 Tax=Odinarchaeota yellowstonii (strain LCB_4) TaxID=1841599 RepID=A0AAF0D266_ODILC|nr:MAG: DMT family transporter [Candidatus Odinarchaeum yellowstonii]